MKAYIVTAGDRLERIATVIFAETASKAKTEALSSRDFTECIYTELRARRCPELDAYYKGKSEINWYDKEGRIALVKYAGLQCSPDVSDFEVGCEECAANEWCGRWQDREDNE